MRLTKELYITISDKLDYDEKKGTLIWNQDFEEHKKGQVAGLKTGTSGLQIKTSLGVFTARRIAYYKHYGEQPRLVYVLHEDRFNLKLKYLTKDKTKHLDFRDSVTQPVLQSHKTWDKIEMDKQPEETETPLNKMLMTDWRAGCINYQKMIKKMRNGEELPEIFKGLETQLDNRVMT